MAAAQMFPAVKALLDEQLLFGMISEERCKLYYTTFCFRFIE
jgi:hypothetical protein